MYLIIGTLAVSLLLPGLNSSFVECNSANTKRIFAAESEPGIILQFANLIKAWRPMPIQSEPGLIDHN